MANDRRSISESISSERTTSSCDININYPRINSIGLLPVGDGSRSSGEMISDGTLASQILSMESFRNQQVSRQAHQDYSRLSHRKWFHNYIFNNCYQAPCSDPKHIPDIVSGHTASTAQCSVEQGSCHAGGYLSQELQSVTTIAAPLRPPRKSQKGPKPLQRQDSEGEVSSLPVSLIVNRHLFCYPWEIKPY